jgi:catechol 2,3-dioxygenase-like lactoylglutathione lyase family enzyme
VIQHVSIEASDLDRSAAFYDAVLTPLGWRRHADSGQGVGWGMAKPVFFVLPSERASPGSGHVCFAAKGIPAVKAAWEAGIQAGGADDGSPGTRPQYGSGYYSANLLDPDGHRIEIAVSPE